MGEVFISYKQDERERMRPIAEGLRALGVDVWFDERLQPDRAFTEEIIHLIQTCRAQLVCWSPAAVASEWVRGEAEMGRQRGVLIAAMMEPTSLPPPFNMHHAESLSGWTGDARHPGWRKICDAIGRRLDRPGLGELAALQVSDDASAWKKWAQKYPDDPVADEAWAKAEELEVAAARERMARERDGAKRPDRQVERSHSASVLSTPAAVPARRTPHSRRSVLNVALAGSFVVALVVAFAVLPPNRWFPDDAENSVVSAELETSSSSPAVAPPKAEQEKSAATETSRSQPVVALRPAETNRSDAGDAARAIVNQISAREWSMTRLNLLARRVIASATVASWEAAAAAGDARAQTILGAGHEFNLIPGPLGDNKELPLYRAAAAQDFGPGQAALAFCYRHGVCGLRQDRSEAVRLYRLAANQGSARAQVELGWHLSRGEGVARDYAEAARYYRLAADQGDAEGQSALAGLYILGLGVARDEVEAVRYLKLASDQGLASARASLGGMYEDGRGGLRADRSEAIRLYKLAAQQGDSHAQLQLTRLGEAWR